ncbi:cobalt-precorrin-4 C(11)-methyltransferase [Klebsiella pneumoniae]|uniref:Cobalt-precorrin-4 C(11)-methyltransferase n=1 Tax=Klebsiella pneumoniae TaxID=573 RepID=A0A2X3FHC0_KLEPN|nr:cobalt-precorrin-4 C(11)-methyltransferase [Klebsiella pneumoniae]
MAETFDPHCVWFVGAGPGDRELITLKGYRLLQQARVVIYAGSLINTELLALLSATGGVPRQRRAASGADPRPDGGGGEGGKTVVRLQTGDVSLYGSVREQGEELTRRGIRWQVVPGVSAFLGAAAELGVEVHGTRSLAESDYYPSGRAHAGSRARTAGSLCQPSNLDGDLPVGATYSPGGGKRLVEGGYPATTPGRGDLQGHLAGKPDRPRYPRGHRRQSTRRRDPQNGADPGRPLPSAMSITTQNCTQRILGHEYRKA